MKPLIPVHIDSLPAASGSGYPEPFNSRVGAGHWRALGDHFGLTQFGVSHEQLAPGAQSSLRHWHAETDELVIVLTGELILRTNDGEFVMRPGMCVGFKAGVPNAHHLVNRSSAEATFIVVGTRHPDDRATYPDDDLDSRRTDKSRVWLHKDGSPYPTG